MKTPKIILREKYPRRKNEMSLYSGGEVIELMENNAKQRNPENERPDDGDKIIFEDAVGMFCGTFHTLRNGVVYVNGTNEDMVEWENVYWWIPYPLES